MVIAIYIPIYQKYLLFYINYNNIKIAFYLDIKVINSLLKKAFSYLCYIFKAYTFYYNVYRSYFELFINI